MEELENTNPVMDNPGDAPATAKDLWAENLAPEPQQAPDFSQLFSENIAENSPAQNESAPAMDTANSQPVQEQNITPSELADQPTETPVQQQPQEQTVNFEQEIAHTSLDNHQNVQPSQEAIEVQKARIEQQKLARLKKHESKAKKSGFASWILSGILLMLLVFTAYCVFAKDQVFNAIDYLNSLMPTNIINTNVIENTEVLSNDIEEAEVIEEENIEEIDPIQEYYNQVDKIVSSEDDQNSKAEELRNILSEVMQKNEETDDELVQYISQTIMDLTINTEQSQNEENDENNSEKNIEEETYNSELNNLTEENEEYNAQENPENTNEGTNEEIIEKNNEPTETIEETIEENIEENIEPYTITQVNSEEEANWVLPAHCSDLTCYGDDNEFTECTSFKMVETLDENSNRISSRWWCKYKDISELVYVEFK